MIACACSHAEHAHELVTIEHGLGRKRDAQERQRCTVDDCACTLYRPRSAPRWIALARLAEHVRRHGEMGVLISESDVARSSRTWAVSVQAGRMRLDLEAPLDDYEEEQLCEMLGMQLLERAQETTRNEATKAESESRRAMRLARTCIVCGVVNGVYCVPTHDGERATGAWVHPERMRDDAFEDDDMARILQWAHSKPSSQQTAIPVRDVAQLADALRRMDDAMRSADTRAMVLEHDLRLVQHQRDANMRAMKRDSNLERGNRVGAARQSCTRCSGTGRVDNGPGTVGDPCHCAAGDLPTFTGVDGVTLLGSELKARFPYLALDPRVAPRAAPAAGTPIATEIARRELERARRDAEDAAEVEATRRNEAARVRAQVGMSMSPALCGCTWGSPCDEHGPYW